MSKSAFRSVVLGVVALGIAVFMLALPASAGPAGLPPTCNTNPCIVKGDNGGQVHLYRELAKRLIETGWQVKIDGECYSACTILMDVAAENVCITDKAVLHIHQSMLMGGPQMGLRANIDYSPRLTAWIDRKGGQPAVGWLTMTNGEAKEFWRSCDTGKEGRVLVSRNPDVPLQHVASESR